MRKLIVSLLIHIQHGYILKVKPSTGLQWKTTIFFFYLTLL